MQKSTRLNYAIAENSFYAALRKATNKPTPANIRQLNQAREGLRRARNSTKKRVYA